MLGGGGAGPAASGNGARVFPWRPGPIQSCRVHSTFQHSLHLTEPLRNEVCLVPDDLSRGFLLRKLLRFEDPLGAYDISPRRCMLEGPVPIVCRASSSSRMACSHSGQSSLRFASARFRGSSASDVPNPRSQPLRSAQFSRKAGKPVSTFKQPRTRREIG